MYFYLQNHSLLFARVLLVRHFRVLCGLQFGVGQGSVLKSLLTSNFNCLRFTPSDLGRKLSHTTSSYFDSQIYIIHVIVQTSTCTLHIHLCCNIVKISEHLFEMGNKIQFTVKVTCITILQNKKDGACESESLWRFNLPAKYNNLKRLEKVDLICISLSIIIYSENIF